MNANSKSNIDTNNIDYQPSSENSSSASLSSGSSSRRPRSTSIHEDPSMGESSKTKNQSKVASNTNNYNQNETSKHHRSHHNHHGYKASQQVTQTNTSPQQDPSRISRVCGVHQAPQDHKHHGYEHNHKHREHIHNHNHNHKTSNVANHSHRPQNQQAIAAKPHSSSHIAVSSNRYKASNAHHRPSHHNLSHNRHHGHQQEQPSRLLDVAKASANLYDRLYESTSRHQHQQPGRHKIYGKRMLHDVYSSNAARFASEPKAHNHHHRGQVINPFKPTTTTTQKQATIKFASQLYFLVHMSLILSLLMHHKMMLNNEKQVTSSHQTARSETFHYHVRRHQQPQTSAQSNGSSSPGLVYGPEVRYGSQQEALATRSNDVLVFLFGNWHAKLMLHYLLCYLLASSVLILIALRLCRFCKRPADIETRNIDRQYYDHGESPKPRSFYKRTRLDCTPVLIGSISLGFVQLTSLGLSIANNIEALTSNSRCPILLAFFQFTFVSLLMQYTLCQVTRKNAAKKHSRPSYVTSRSLDVNDFSARLRLRRYSMSNTTMATSPEPDSITSKLDSSQLIAASSTAARQANNCNLLIGSDLECRRAQGFLSRQNNGQLNCHLQSSATAKTSESSHSIGHNLHNIALAHLLVTQMLLWLLELNSISLFHVPSMPDPSSMVTLQANPINGTHSRLMNPNHYPKQIVHEQRLASPAMPHLVVVSNKPAEVVHHIASQNATSPVHTKPPPVPADHSNVVVAAGQQQQQPSNDPSGSFSSSSTSGSGFGFGSSTTASNNYISNESLLKSMVVRRKSPPSNLQNLTEPPSEPTESVVHKFTMETRNQYNPNQNQWPSTNSPGEPKLQYGSSDLPSAAVLLKGPADTKQTLPVKHRLDLASLSNRPLKPVSTGIAGSSNNNNQASYTTMDNVHSAINRPHNAVASSSKSTAIPKRPTVFKPASKPPVQRDQMIFYKPDQNSFKVYMGPTSGTSTTRRPSNLMATKTSGPMEQPKRVTTPKEESLNIEHQHSSKFSNSNYNSSNKNKTTQVSKPLGSKGAATKPPYAKADSDRRKPIKPLRIRNEELEATNEVSTNDAIEPQNASPETTTTITTSSMAPSSDDAIIEDLDSKGDATTQDGDVEDDLSDLPVPPNVDDDQDQPPTTAKPISNKQTSNRQPPRSKLSVLHNNITEVIPVAGQSSRKSPSFTADDELAFNEAPAAVASDIDLSRAEMLTYGDFGDATLVTTPDAFNQRQYQYQHYQQQQQGDQFGSSFGSFLMPIVRQYHILIVAILLNFWLDGLNQTNAGHGIEGLRGFIEQPNRRNSQFSTAISGRDLIGSTFTSQNSSLDLDSLQSQQRRTSRSKRHQQASMEVKVVHKGLAKEAGRSLSSESLRPRKRRSEHSHHHQQHDDHRQGSSSASSPGSASVSHATSTSASGSGSRASSERLLWADHAHFAPQNRRLSRNVHLYSGTGNWPSSSSGASGLEDFARQHQAHLSSRHRARHASACSLFFGLLVGSGSLIAILVGIDMISMLAQSLVELLTIITCVIGLCIIWRTKRRHKRLERLNALLRGTHLTSTTTTNNNRMLGPLGGIILASDQNNRLWQSKPTIYEQTSSKPQPQVIAKLQPKVEQLDDATTRSPSHRQAFHYLFLLAAYFSGASIALNLDHRHNMQQMFSQPVIYFLETRFAHLVAQPSQPNSLRGHSYGQLSQPIDHFQFLFHLLLGVKALLLILQVTIQSALVRCSCERSSQNLRHIYTFLMFANMSLWAMEICTDKQPAHQQLQSQLGFNLNQTNSSYMISQPEVTLLGFENVSKFASSLVTLSHLYHGLVFI